VKITFEAKTIGELLEQVQEMFPGLKVSEPAPPVIVQEAIAPVDEQEAEPPIVDKPVDNPLDVPMEKPSSAERMAKARAAKKPKAAKAPAPEHPQEPFSDPADIVKLRQRTINDLQEAYANGHQAEVFELLSRFGNGAKSFRELPADAFVPIREAIDSGALT